MQATPGSFLVCATFRTNLDMYRNILLLKLMNYLYNDLESFLQNQT